MTAGKRDQLVTIQRGTPSTDDYGGETITWATLATEWAAVFYGRGDERRQAAVERGQQAAVFQVLSNTDTRSVNLEDRISHDGSYWNIIGIAPATPKRGLIELAAVRAL